MNIFLKETGWRVSLRDGRHMYSKPSIRDAENNFILFKENDALKVELGTYKEERYA